MNNTLLLCLVALCFLGGCRKQEIPTGPDALIRPTPSQVVIVNGFAGAGTAVVDQNGFRVNGYFDFTSYDSIQINFEARRLGSQHAFDRILVKVGPAFYLKDSLSSSSKQVSLLVKRSDLVKAHSSALVFYGPENEEALQLSKLQVIGWR